jgi:hypothetical protein
VERRRTPRVETKIEKARKERKSKCPPVLGMPGMKVAGRKVGMTASVVVAVVVATTAGVVVAVITGGVTGAIAMVHEGTVIVLLSRVTAPFLAST